MLILPDADGKNLTPNIVVICLPSLGEPCSDCCGPFGGTLTSFKTIDGMNQTLGDYDQSSPAAMKGWNKERFLRQTLVIRYIDKANDRVEEVSAFIEPNESSKNLYKVAAAIEASKTLTVKDWLAAKSKPTPGAFGAFNFTHEAIIMSTVFSGTPYRASLGVLVLVSLIISIVTKSATGGVLQFLGIGVGLSGSFNVLGQGAEQPSYNNDLRNIAAQALAGVIYIIGLSVAF
ncbi:unnamed protein product [Choristocarpus tenellus]